MRRTERNAGFSLIELMVVVAIIGILATIGATQYQKMQARARQSEVKANLSGLYAAESSFYAEWNWYFGDFRDVGFQPEGRLRYRVGFSGAGANIPGTVGYTGPSGTAPANAVATIFSSANFCCATGVTAPPCAGTGARCQEVTTTVAALPVALTAQTTFVAGGAGNIDSDATIDQWTMNQAKAMTNVAGNIDLAD